MYIYHYNRVSVLAGPMPPEAREATAPEIADYLALRGTPEAREALLKELRARIDAVTDETILTGFEHDGKKFYLSLENQMNYKAECDLRHTLIYPVTIKTQDGYCTIASPAEYFNFFQAAYAYIRTVLADGWRRKDALAQLTDDELKELAQ